MYTLMTHTQSSQTLLYFGEVVLLWVGVDKEEEAGGREGECLKDSIKWLVFN